MGWLLWMFFVWFVISRFARRRRRWSGWYVGPGGWWLATQAPRGPYRVAQPRAVVIPAPVREPSVRERREQRMAELRRRYVADDISVEEYEAGLDRVLRDS